MSIFFNLRLMKKFLFLIIILIFSNHSFADEELINLINEKLIEIGEFKEPREYPEGFLKTTAKKCKDLKFICIQDKAVKEMSLRFKRTDKYNDKNPGNQVYAMAHFEYIYSYAPYNNIKKMDYPHMLITTSLSDNRVLFDEPLKFTAKLREYKTDNNLLLLKTEMNAGHGGKSGRDGAIEEIALDYAFALKVTNRI